MRRSEATEEDGVASVAESIFFVSICMILEWDFEL